MRSRSQTVCELKGGSESAGRKEGICGKQKEDLKSEQVEVKQKKIGLFRPIVKMAMVKIGSVEGIVIKRVVVRT